MGADQFGHGGSRRIPKSKIQKSKKGGSHTGGGGSHKQGCCPMAAAVRSVKLGNYLLARRYAAMSIRLLATRLSTREIHA